MVRAVSDPAPIVTSMLALAENPFMVAVMVVLPAPTAVASPDEFMVATAVSLEAHVTWFVTSLTS